MGIMDKLNSYSQYKDSDVFRPGAFNPGLFKTNKKQVKKLRPDMYSLTNLLLGGNANNPGFIQTQMNDGDMGPAIVVSKNPLLVACYSWDMDAVVFQCYPDELGEYYGWNVGTKLITVMTYNGMGAIKKNKDLTLGQRCNNRYKSVGPIIADLFTDNKERLERKKSEISTEWWDYTEKLAKEYMVEYPNMARNGLGFSFKDAQDISKIKFNRRIKLD